MVEAADLVDLNDAPRLRGADRTTERRRAPRCPHRGTVNDVSSPMEPIARSIGRHLCPPKTSPAPEIPE